MNPVRVRAAVGTAGRRVVHVLLGAVVLLPYVAFGWLFTLAVSTGMTPAALVPLLALTVVVGVAVAVVPGVRALEVTAARSLLGVTLPEPDPSTERDWSVRRRGALWLLLCMVLGGLGALLLLLGLPTAVGFLIAPWLPQPPLPTGADAWWAPVVGVLTVVASVAVVVAAGALLARAAPRLLGPTPSERLAAELVVAQRRATRQAERARIARELHDSVGHALTVTTLQAGAASELLDSDPAFARRALAAIEETGRRALDDLDHVLGVLREDDGAVEAPRDLDALDTLVDGARTAGVEVEVYRDGELAGLPAVVSREGYRLVQEALTNALRHAGPVPVTVRLSAARTGLELTVDNPLPSDGTRTGRGGRGLRGMAERAALLGGQLTAGPDDGVWRLAARLPCGGPVVEPGEVR
ncbi:sensor histidine kinase [Pseudonocardia endophytica]|uniref:histidine kinase n=1 Tax=Pseudonocardia endophytica TaxID=401976 RepID=A0A4R1HS25_PSEEN|nr:histidine kinase [Pseudonocardia endophytica]TCK24978.1 histidine kinase [Pseudonocardia endophytica]